MIRRSGPELSSVRALRRGVSAGFLAGLSAVAAATGVAAGIDPIVGVGAAFGIVFAVVFVADLPVGLAIFTVVTFVAVTPQIAGGPGLAKVAGLVLTGSWAAAMAVSGSARRNMLPVRPAMLALPLGFLAWVALSVAWAEQAGPALDFLGRYALNVVLFFIVCTTVRGRKDILLVCGAFVVGSTLAALAGFVSPPAPGTAGRLETGTFDPNELASVLVAGSVFAFFFAGALRAKASLRFGCAAAALVCIAGVLLTASRGGLMALAAALALAPFLAPRSWRPKLSLAALGVAALAVAYFVAIASPESTQRVTEFGSGSGRTDLWTVGWRMVESHPFTGIGPGNFPVVSIDYLLEPGLLPRSDFIASTPMVAHNLYLQILAEEGAIGLVLFLGIVVAGVASSWRAARRFERRCDVSMEALARATVIATVALLVADFFLSAQFSKQLWLLLGLGVAMHGVARAGDDGRS